MRRQKQAVIRVTNMAQEIASLTERVDALALMKTPHKTECECCGANTGEHAIPCAAWSMTVGGDSVDPFLRWRCDRCGFEWRHGQYDGDAAGDKENKA